MALTKPSKLLRRELISAASDLKWMAGDMMLMAERLGSAGNEPEAWALLKMCTMLQATEEKLNGYADQVRDGQISKQKPE
jgi:hypothetical protein